MPKRFFFWEALPKSGYGKVPKRLVRDELEARGLLELTAKQTGDDAKHRPARPARARTHPMGRGARPRVLRSRLQAGPAAAGSRAPGFCGGRLCRRRAELQGRGARPVRLCDAGAFEDRRQRGVLQRHLSARRRHAAEDRRDDARRSATARRSSIATRCGPRPTGAAMAAISCPRRPCVAEPFAVDAFGLDGAVFTAEPDPETNFKLFGPVPSRIRRTRQRPAAPSRCGCVRTRISPGALEAFCRQHGILRARLHGGVGSTIGARFTDGRSVVPFATELAVSSGAVASGAGGTLEAAARCRAGRLSRRPRRGPAGARRQSGADDDGAGAGGAGGRRAVGWGGSNCGFEFQTANSSSRALAKQSILPHKERMECFANARNDGKIQFRILATRGARGLQLMSLEKTEGAGNAGCPLHPQPRAQR